MTLQELLEKYNGQYVEVAGPTAKNQCVDLANLYIRDVLGFPMIEWTNAKDFPSKADGRYDYILNTPTGVPQEGDLVIWGGTYGHIAIFIEGNTNSFRSFDQNYPVGSPCHVQNHTYSNVLGWMRAKIIDQQAIIDELRLKRDENWNLYQTELQKNNDLSAKLQECQVNTQALRDAFDRQTKADVDLGAELLDVSHERDDLKADLKSIATTLNTSPDLKAILGAIDGLRSASDDIYKEYKVLAKAFEESGIYKRVPTKFKNWWERLLWWLR